MRTVIARIFDYSLDGLVAEEGASFFDFCRILPDDPIQIAHERDFFANADVHIMGRKHWPASSLMCNVAPLKGGTTAPRTTCSPPR